MEQHDHYVDRLFKDPDSCTGPVLCMASNDTER